MTLDCSGEAESWTFANKNGSTEVIEEGSEKYQLAEDKSLLTIEDVEEEQLGVYFCLGEDGTVLNRYELDVSLKLKKLSKSYSVDDGAKQEITCSLKSTLVEGEEVVFQWFVVPEEVEEPLRATKTQLCSKGATGCSNIKAEALFDQRDKSLPVPALENRSEILTGATEEDDTPYTTLKIDPVYLEDRQHYVCRAVLKSAQDFVEDCSKSKDCDETSVLLRVKDPLAALWPFIGIVAEVVLLCLIIFFCERGKREEKEDYDEHIRK